MKSLVKAPGHNHSTNNFFAIKSGCYAFLHKNSAQFCELQPVPDSPVSTKCQNVVTDSLLVGAKRSSNNEQETCRNALCFRRL